MLYIRKQGGRYSYAYRQALLARVRIEDVIESFVKLKRVNENYAYGLCPFHQEQSPSFTVSEKGQFYHCYGCGSHGGVVKFLTDYHALYSLKRRVEKELRLKGKDFWQIHEIVERYSRRFLKDKKEFDYLDAIRYLAKKYSYWPAQHKKQEKRSEKI